MLFKIVWQRLGNEQWKMLTSCWQTSRVNLIQWFWFISQTVHWFVSTIESKISLLKKETISPFTCRDFFEGSSICHEKLYMNRKEKNSLPYLISSWSFFTYSNRLWIIIIAIACSSNHSSSCVVAGKMQIGKTQLWNHFHLNYMMSLFCSLSLFLSFNT